MNRFTLSAIALAASLGATASFAESLNVVCSNEQAWCDLMAQNFEIDTGIDTAVVRKSTGEVLAQIRAEAGNPKVDVWWGRHGRSAPDRRGRGPDSRFGCRCLGPTWMVEEYGGYDRGQGHRRSCRPVGYDV